MRPRSFEPEQLRALMDEQLPIAEIAARFGVHPGAIYKAVRRYDLPPIKRKNYRKPWCPPHHWPTYIALRSAGLSAAERRAVVEKDIARERRA